MTNARTMLFFAVTAFAALGQTTLTVDATRTIREFGRAPIGINVDYLMDDDGYLRPRTSTADALKKMNVKFLRYPGGEKSDNYLWSVAPWTAPNPHFARTASQDWPSSDTRFAQSDRYTCKSTVLDFDEFMTICRAVGAEAVLVVCFDAMYKAAYADGSAPTRSELMETAVEWVRYANVTKKYAVKYWEIGNESYHSGSYNGIAPDASTYANDLADFARAMKAVDPTIRIGANGNGGWWSTLQSVAGAEIDFLAAHSYPTWDYAGYNQYRDGTPNFTGEVNSAIGSIGGRNQFAALTEYNAIYWGGGTGWSNTNDMGHALAVFDIAMQHVVLPGVAFSLLWNTRWVDNAGKQFDINDALDKDGNLNATGKALAVLGNHLLPRIKPVSGLSARVRAWAAACATGDTLNMLIVNKGPGETALTLRVDGMAYDTVFIRERLAGSGPGDTAPALTGTARGGESLTVPDASVTVVSFVKYGAVTRARTGLTGRAGSSRRAGTDVRFSDCAGRRLDAARVRQNFAGVYFVESCRTGTFHRVLRRD